MLFVANKKKRISSLLLHIGESLMGGGWGWGGRGPNQKRHFRGAGDRIGEFGRGKEEVLVRKKSPDLRSPEVGISAFVQSEKI